MAELQEDISNLSNNTRVPLFYNEQGKRYHTIKRVFEAIHRQSIREKKKNIENVQAIQKRALPVWPTIPTSTKLALKGIIKMFVILLRHSDEETLNDCLTLAAELLNELKPLPLSLVDSSSFLPEYADCLAPFLNYVRNLVPKIKNLSLCYEILVGYSMARGDLNEMLLVLRELFLSTSVTFKAHTKAWSELGLSCDIWETYFKNSIFNIYSFI